MMENESLSLSNRQKIVNGVDSQLLESFHTSSTAFFRVNCLDQRLGTTTIKAIDVVFREFISFLYLDVHANQLNQDHAALATKSKHDFRRILTPSPLSVIYWDFRWQIPFYLPSFRVRHCIHLLAKFLNR